MEPVRAILERLLKRANADAVVLRRRGRLVLQLGAAVDVSAVTVDRLANLDGGSCADAQMLSDGREVVVVFGERASVGIVRLRLKQAVDELNRLQVN